MNKGLLPTLASDINREHNLATDAAHTAIEHALKAGELLIKAKQAVKHGKWLPWLEKNCSIGERTARNYMRLAKLPEAKRQRVADMPLRQAIEDMAEPPYKRTTALLERALQWTQTTLKMGGTFEVEDMVKNALVPREKAGKLLEEMVASNEVEKLSLSELPGFIDKAKKLEVLVARVALSQKRLLGLWIANGTIKK